MKKTVLIKKLTSACVCFALIAAIALGITGCGKQADNTASGTLADTVGSAVTVSEVGKGSKSFSFTVEADGKTKEFTVKTDKTKVGEALLDAGLITGEDGDYGLYVKSVNGITADYNKDKAYWAFYINGKYANAGVDMTEIKEGDKYAFKKEKS